MTLSYDLLELELELIRLQCFRSWVGM
jgi:hypothetical protein